MAFFLFYCGKHLLLPLLLWNSWVPSPCLLEISLFRDLRLGQEPGNLLFILLSFVFLLVCYD